MSPDDYLKKARPLGITGTIVVEASSWLEDNDWVMALGRRDRALVGFVGSLGEAFGRPVFEAQLGRLAKNPLFRGVRIGEAQVAAALSDPRALRELQALSDADLSVDTLGVPLRMVAQLAGRLPSLRLVVDHMAGVDPRNPGAAWLAGLEEISPHRNVFMKLSGLVEGTKQTGGKAPTDPAAYRQALDAAWLALGEDRLIFATNWPVCEQFASLATVHDIVRSFLVDKTPAAREKVYFRNAQAAYKWLSRA